MSRDHLRRIHFSPDEFINSSEDNNNSSRRSLWSSSTPLLLFVVIQGAIFSLLILPQHGHLLKGSRSYSHAAEQILNQGVFSTYRPPSYPLLIAGIMSLCGEYWPYAISAFHGLTAIACGVLIFTLTESLSHSRRAAIFALLLYLSDLVLQLELASARETSLYLTLQAAALWLWVCGRRTLTSYFLLGAVLGLLHLTRPNGILVFGCIALLELFGSRPPPSSRLSIVAALVVGFGATIAPWQIELRNLTGSWTIASSTSQGLNLWKGNNRFSNAIIPWMDVDDLEVYAERDIHSDNLSASDSDTKLKNAALSYIGRHPLATMWFTFKKGLIFFAPTPTPLGVGDIQEEGETVLIDNFRPRKGWLALTLHASFLYAGVLLAIYFRKKIIQGENRDFFAFNALLAGLSFFVHGITFPETRLRLPLDLLFIIVAAIGFERLSVHRRLSVSAHPLQRVPTDGPSKLKG